MDNLTTTAAIPVTIDESLQNAISFRPFGITIALWSIFVGSVGNLLTILTYLANVKLRTTFNMFLVNLAVIDFWTAVGMLPFNLAGYVQMKWPFESAPFTARLQAFQYFSCGYSSIVFLVAITVNRFVGVVFPGKYGQLFTKNRTVAVLVLCNFFAPLLLLPSLVGTDEGCAHSGGALTGFNSKQFVCTFVCLPDNSGWMEYMMFMRVVFQFVPLIVMLVLYAFILTSAKKTRNAVSTRYGISGKQSFSSGKSIVVGQNQSEFRKKSDQDRRRQREDKRMTLISVVICIAFMVTFLPSMIVNLLPNRREIDVRWHMAASNVTWFNSSVNPIIYVFLNRRFRREYWRIIKYAFGSVKGQFVHKSSTAQSSAAPHGLVTLRV